MNNPNVNVYRDNAVVERSVEVYVNNEYVGYCKKYGNKWGCSTKESGCVYSGGRSLREVFDVLLDEVLMSV